MPRGKQVFVILQKALKSPTFNPTFLAMPWLRSSTDAIANQDPTNTSFHRRRESRETDLWPRYACLPEMMSFWQSEIKKGAIRRETCISLNG